MQVSVGAGSGGGGGGGCEAGGGAGVPGLSLCPGDEGPGAAEDGWGAPGDAVPRGPGRAEAEAAAVTAAVPGPPDGSPLPATVDRCAAGTADGRPGLSLSAPPGAGGSVGRSSSRTEPAASPCCGASVASSARLSAPAARTTPSVANSAVRRPERLRARRARPGRLRARRCPAGTGSRMWSSYTAGSSAAGRPRSSAGVPQPAQARAPLRCLRHA